MINVKPYFEDKEVGAHACSVQRAEKGCSEVRHKTGDELWGEMMLAGVKYQLSRKGH